jgi:release factor glutamine methyltransferase
VFDPGYGIHQRFFDEVKPHLAEDGRIFMNTSDTMGDPKSIVALAVRMGFAVRKHHSNRIEIPGSLIGWTPAVAAAADEHGKADFVLDVTATDADGTVVATLHGDYQLRRR